MPENHKLTNHEDKMVRKQPTQAHVGIILG